MTKTISVAALVAVISLVSTDARAGTLTVELDNAKGVTMVGVIQRWDADGNHRKLPDQKGKIDAPAIDAKAANAGGGRWAFKNLPKGKYDLVILADGRRRIEGFQYVPMKEFDPFLPPDASLDDDTREIILDDVKKSQFYENIVEPLYVAGDKKSVRLLAMLIRDKTTSYESEFPGAATIRHEMWLYNWNYGAWQKDRRTKVMDRALLNRDELHQWTWLWDPKLGGIEVNSRPVALKYALPGPGEKTLKGLYPR